jgi:hypothetical protein
MNAQQVQGQAPKWPRRVRITLFLCALGLIAAAVFWLLNIQPGVFSTIFGASGVIFTLIAVYPIIVPPKTPDLVSSPPQVTVNTPVTVNNVVPPTPINNYIVLPASRPAPQVQVPTTPDSQSQAALAAGSSYAHPISLRSLPLPGGAKHIQRREKNVKDIYAQLIESGVSAVALCGIGGVGKSTLAALIFDYTKEERNASRGPFAGEPVLLRLNENTSFLELATNIYACVERPMPPDFAHLPPQAQAYALFNALNTSTSPETPRLVILDQFENLLDPQTGRALTTNAGVGELNCSTRSTASPAPAACCSRAATSRMARSIMLLPLCGSIACVTSANLRALNCCALSAWQAMKGCCARPPGAVMVMPFH